VELFWWIVIIVCFVAGLVGIVLPVLPSVALVWAGVAIYHFFIDSAMLGWLTWGSMLLFTVIILVVDQISNVMVVKRYGASKLSVFASLVGAFLGMFAFPPFGIVLVPFFLVLIVELLQNRPLDQAFNVAFGTIVAFVGSTFAKGLMQIIMVGTFLLDVFVIA